MVLFFNINTCCWVCSVILTLCESVGEYLGHLKPVETCGLVLDNKNVILDWEKITVAGKEAGKVECFLERGERSSLLRCDRMVIFFVSDGMVIFFFMGNEEGKVKCFL